jgi:hypothetical protein
MRAHVTVQSDANHIACDIGVEGPTWLEAPMERKALLMAKDKGSAEQVMPHDLATVGP